LQMTVEKSLTEVLQGHLYKTALHTEQKYLSITHIIGVVSPSSTGPINNMLLRDIVYSLVVIIHSIVVIIRIDNVIY